MAPRHGSWEDDDGRPLEPCQPAAEGPAGRLERWTGRVVLNGCLVVLISALAGIGVGELVWIFLRFLVSDSRP